MTVKTAPRGHGTIMAGMPNVFIENMALTWSQHGEVRFTLIRDLLFPLGKAKHQRYRQLMDTKSLQPRWWAVPEEGKGFCLGSPVF